MKIWSGDQFEWEIFGFHNCNGDGEERSRGLRRREGGRVIKEFGFDGILRILGILGFLMSFGDFEIF